MNVYLNKITGIEDAIISMYMSKRHWTKELDDQIRMECFRRISPKGYVPYQDRMYIDDWMTKLVKIGQKHPTILRFIDLSVTVEGLHRAGQDDWDSHAKRFDNRIIRSSTRLSEYNNEKSEWYEGKIMTTDEALKLLDMELPDNIVTADGMMVRTMNGYIREDLAKDKDTKRGLYMLSIPSNFIFKCCLPEFAHVYRERGMFGGAHDEVKNCCESIVDQLELLLPWFNREFLLSLEG